jgi:hypothetical protein
MQQTTDLEASRARLREASARVFTWHDLSHWTAKLLLLVAFLFWFRAEWLAIAPQWPFMRTPEGALSVSLDRVMAFVLDVVLAAGLAVARATVPPIFISSLVANSPADVVLNRLRARITGWGMLFVWGGAIWLCWDGFGTLIAYWASRTTIPESTMYQVTSYSIYESAFTTLALLVLFPAWSLNKMMPQEWIEAMIMAREAMRLQRLLDLEDAGNKALVVMMRSLLQADLTTMTLEEREKNAAHIAGTLATANKAVNRAITALNGSIRGLAGVDVYVQTDSDDVITDRYQYVMKSLAQGEQATRETVEFAGTLIDVTPTAPALPAPAPGPPAPAIAAPTKPAMGAATTMAAPAVAPGGPQRELTPVVDALAVARAAFPHTFTRAELEVVLSVRRARAGKFITDWVRSGAVAKVADQKDHYKFT